MKHLWADLCWLSVAQAASLLRRRELSPVELVRAHLERIQQVDPKVQAYVTLVPEAALAEARAAEEAIMQGCYRGPLHGIPIALKDLYDTQGVRTTAQSKVLADRVPQEDATAVTRLKAAGTVLLGKLAMHEFALGGPQTTLFQPARNPWALTHVPGGSSSGSAAAVAAGLCMASLGSDTGGSIRGPAQCCGIVGLKPTYGRVSRFGVVPLSWSLDHCGPMTRTVEDTVILLQAISGYDPRDPTTSKAPVPDYSAALPTGIRDTIIAVPRHYFAANQEEMDAESLGLVEKAMGMLEGLGAHMEEVTIPSLEYVRAAHLVIMQGEAFTYHQGNLKTRPADYGEAVRLRFYMGSLYTAADYVQAQRARSRITREFTQVLERADVILTPTAPRPAGTFESYDPLATLGGINFMAPFNLTGMPAISIPCGFTVAGLPVGLQIAGRLLDEPAVLRVAYAYEQATRWCDRRPPL